MNRVLSTDVRSPTLVGGNARGTCFPDYLRLLGRDSDMTEIYRLRYRAYRAAGWIGHRDDAILRDRFDVMPNMLSLAAFNEQGCICAFRLHTTDVNQRPRGDLPSDAVFPEILTGLKCKGYSRISELGRLAVEPDLPNRSFRTTMLMSIVRAAGVVCYATGVEFAVVAVHKEISGFYRGLFGFELLAEAEEYNDIAEPTHFLGRPLRAMDRPHSTRNRFFEIPADELEQAREAIAALNAARRESRPQTEPVLPFPAAAG